MHTWAMYSGRTESDMCKRDMETQMDGPKFPASATQARRYSAGLSQCSPKKGAAGPSKTDNTQIQAGPRKAQDHRGVQKGGPGAPKICISQAQAQCSTHLLAKQTLLHLLRGAIAFPRGRKLSLPGTGVFILKGEVRKSSLPSKVSRASPFCTPPQATMREIVHIQAGQVWLLA